MCVPCNVDDMIDACYHSGEKCYIMQDFTKQKMSYVLLILILT